MTDGLIDFLCAANRLQEVMTRSNRKSDWPAWTAAAAIWTAVVFNLAAPSPPAPLETACLSVRR